MNNGVVSYLILDLFISSMFCLLQLRHGLLSWSRPSRRPSHMRQLIRIVTIPSASTPESLLKFAWKFEGFLLKSKVVLVLN
jgi:hypothetical protein